MSTRLRRALSDRGDPPSRDVRAYVWCRNGAGQTGKLLEWNGVCAVAGNDGPYSFRLGPQTEIPKGASGGPVVDLAQDALVGLTKASKRSSEGDIKDGGRAVRATSLREFVSPVVVDPDHALGSGSMGKCGVWRVRSTSRTGVHDRLGGVIHEYRHAA
jgi:hypothetical protein